MSQSVRSDTLRIAVASNFYPALSIIADEFSLRYGHQVLLSSGASGKHYAQIVNGAPFDLFFSADQLKPAALEEKGLGDSNYRFTYAIGQLALVGKCESNTDIKACFKKNQFESIALAHPGFAPYGKAAEEVLTSLGILKHAARKQRFGHNVAQAFQFVETNNVELALVALSLLKQSNSHDRQHWVVPQSYHRPIKQDVVLLKASAARSAAVQFLDFLSDNISQDIMQNYGYLTPDSKLMISDQLKSVEVGQEKVKQHVK